MAYGKLNQNTKSKCVVRRIALDRQGYERGGRYWGIGAKLWEVETLDGHDEGETEHVRAATISAAKLHFPNAKWGTTRTASSKPRRTFERSMAETLEMRGKIPSEFKPLFDHCIELAKSAYKNGNPTRAGQDLLHARRLIKYAKK